jgi:hypothetical protein
VVSLIKLFQIHLGVEQKVSLQSSHLCNSSTPPSKIHALVDTNGRWIRLALTTGEAHDNPLAAKFLSRLRSGSMLLADRGYGAD